MSDRVIKGKKRLRTGITTGSCATAAAKAAAIALLGGEDVGAVDLITPNGTSIRLEIADTRRGENIVSCSVVKDAGDDPDATNGMTLTASVSRGGEGMEIDGGSGVGRVTKAGLKIPVGQAAINPTPLAMIRGELAEVCRQFGYEGGLRVTVCAPDGVEVAKRTMNERLGIVGGISILGTTGIVEPMSEGAIIDTIRAEIDVHIAAGRREILVTPGNYGRDFARENLNLDIEQAVKCSNFIGDTLDYAQLVGVRRVLLIGHAGKLVKLAGGVMNTHSSVADCRMEIIAAHGALCGMDAPTVREVMECVTVDAATDVIMRSGLFAPVWESIGKKIAFHLRERARGLCVECVIFTQERGVLARVNTERCER